MYQGSNWIEGLRSGDTSVMTWLESFYNFVKSYNLDNFSSNDSQLGLQLAILFR